METSKRKRGISLTHHQRNNSSIISTEEVHQHPQIPTTHFHYPRYPMAMTSSRHASAPKPAVNFCYHIKSQASLVPTPLEIRECQLEKSEVYSVSHVLKSFNRIEHPLCDKVENENTLQKYQSFEHCKEVLGKRLFGDSNISQSKQNHTNRVNRFQQPFINHNSYLINDSNFNISANSLQVSQKVILKTIEEEKKSKEIKALTISNIQNITIKPDIQPKEVEKVKKTKREPMNLNQMERRLKEIIKICDQHI